MHTFLPHRVGIFRLFLFQRRISNQFFIPKFRINFQCDPKFRVNLVDAGLAVNCECRVKDTIPFLHEIARQQYAGKVSSTVTINGESCQCSSENGQEDKINIKNLNEE